MNSVFIRTAVLSVLAAASVQAAPTLTLEPSVRHLVAGRDEAATLVVRGPPDSLKDARLLCSAGTTRALKRTTPGELRFELTPPRLGEASWLVCAVASANSRTFGTTTLELQRREVLALANLPPLSRVEVKIGAAVFGPVRANGAGFAEVPVLLTPSTRTAEVIATPPGLEPQVRPRPLSVNQAEQTLLVPTANDLVADGQTPVTVFAFTFNERGELASETLTLASDEGRFEEEVLGTGVRLLGFIAHPRAVPGEATLNARTARGKPAVAKLALTAGVVPRLELRSNVAGLPADGVATAELSVTVQDQAGRGLPFQKLLLSANLGVVSGIEEKGGGAYVARYSAPASTATEVLITAAVEGSAPTTLTLKLIPPPRLTVDSSPKELPADGRSRAVLSIFARGADGQPLPDGSVLQLSSSLGQVSGPVVTAGGRATAELVAGTRAGIANVDIRSADASASAQVRLTPGPVAQVLVRPERDAITCDGNDSVAVRLAVHDAYGNGLESLPIEISEDEDGNGAKVPRGRFDRVATAGNGEFVVRYHGPNTCERGVIPLVASSGGIKGTANVRMVRGFATAFGLTFRVAGVHNLGRIASGALEVEGDLPVAIFGPRFLATAAALVALSAPFGGTTLHRDRGSHPWQASALFASVFVGPRWTLYEDERSHLYLGGGIDGHFVRTTFSVNAAAGVDGTPQGFALGGHLRLGGGYAWGPGLLMSQVRLGFAPWTASSAAVSGQLSGVSVSFGYRLPL